jgi:cation transport regulator
MPYKSIDELPESVKNNLPEDALEVYKEAFNSAAEFYKDPKKRDNPDDDPEDVAHKVAWTAVKDAGFRKNEESGEWEKIKSK